ncbi:MAG: response regulator, partial [Mariprofundales bacterium]
EQMSLEEQLQQAQKMESIGTLVGGIAHDFNNMLAAITTGLYLARQGAQALPKVASRIEKVEGQCFRAADMIKQLLTYARKGVVHIVPFDLTAFLKEAMKLSRMTIPENIQLHFTVGAEKLQIRGDTTQLQQILMNLLVNARDAVAKVDQPSIGVSLSPFKADKAFHQRYPDLEGNDFACLSVSDNGYGIPESLRNKIFEPYFTTKEVGKGSGLGLAMLYGAVQTHQGAVEVESKVGAGTRFHIYLPIDQSEEDAPIQQQSSVVETDCKGVILLADDNRDVRETMAQVLEELGLDVMEAADGQQAVDLFRQQQATIDVVMLDVVMPYKGGVAAAKEIRELCPDIPVIFHTGYDMEHVLAKNESFSNCVALRKPVRIQELSSTINRMLKKGLA